MIKILQLPVRLIIIFILLAMNESNNSKGVYIRINQLGFLTDDLKSGIVLSDRKIDGEDFKVVCFSNDEVEYKGKLKKSEGSFGNFPFSYRFYFSSFRKEGEYVISVNGIKSAKFKIGTDIYNDVVDSLMMFFKVQRCGYTDPILHKICHRVDATSVIEGGSILNRQIDLTGGWHDAGDYVKFLNTTAYTTYTLLFAFDFDSRKFGFDNDKKGGPDILEEARVGLDWMLRCNYEKYKLVTQVQDLKDHEQGFRLPEEDKLEFDRPAYTGIGKNIVGIYVATMALASRIWADRMYDQEFANKCLTVAENLYSMRNSIPDIDSSGSGMYLDNNYAGKLSLGAVELFLTTNRTELFNDAVYYADLAGSDYWWSWGDLNSYAHYRLAKFDKRFTDYIKNNLIVFNSNKDKNLFGEGVALTWGSNNTLLGISLQYILYNKLTNYLSFDTVAVYQRDYILGRNQWGNSFITGFGEVYSSDFHHQVSYIKGVKLPGGLAAGPVAKDFYNQYKIPLEKPDLLKEFQTRDAVYFDDRMDYVTNEPTISANATAIFVMGNFSKR